MILPDVVILQQGRPSLRARLVGWLHRHLTREGRQLSKRLGACRP